MKLSKLRGWTPNPLPLMSHVAPRTPIIIILAELDTYTMYCYHHYSKMQKFIEWI